MGFDFRWVPMGFGLEFSGFDLLMDFGMVLSFGFRFCGFQLCEFCFDIFVGFCASVGSW